MKTITIFFILLVAALFPSLMFLLSFYGTPIGVQQVHMHAPEIRQPPSPRPPPEPDYIIMMSRLPTAYELESLLEDCTLLRMDLQWWFRQARVQCAAEFHQTYLIRPPPDPDPNINETGELLLAIKLKRFDMFDRSCNIVVESPSVHYNTSTAQIDNDDVDEEVTIVRCDYDAYPMDFMFVETRHLDGEDRISLTHHTTLIDTWIRNSNTSVDATSLPLDTSLHCEVSWRPEILSRLDECSLQKGPMIPLCGRYALFTITTRGHDGILVLLTKRNGVDEPWIHWIQSTYPSSDLGIDQSTNLPSTLVATHVMSVSVIGCKEMHHSPIHRYSHYAALRPYNHKCICNGRDSFRTLSSLVPSQVTSLFWSISTITACTRPIRADLPIFSFWEPPSLEKIKFNKIRAWSLVSSTHCYECELQCPSIKQISRLHEKMSPTKVIISVQTLGCSTLMADKKYAGCVLSLVATLQAGHEQIVTNIGADLRLDFFSGACSCKTIPGRAYLNQTQILSLTFENYLDSTLTSLNLQSQLVWSQRELRLDLCKVSSNVMHRLHREIHFVHSPWPTKPLTADIIDAAAQFFSSKSCTKSLALRRSDSASLHCKQIEFFVAGIDITSIKYWCCSRCHYMVVIDTNTCGSLVTLLTRNNLTNKNEANLLHQTLALLACRCKQTAAVIEKLKNPSCNNSKHVSQSWFLILWSVWLEGCNASVDFPVLLMRYSSLSYDAILDLQWFGSLNSVDRGPFRFYHQKQPFSSILYVDVFEVSGLPRECQRRAHITMLFGSHQTDCVLELISCAPICRRLYATPALVYLPQSSPKCRQAAAQFSCSDQVTPWLVASGSITFVSSRVMPGRSCFLTQEHYVLRVVDFHPSSVKHTNISNEFDEEMHTSGVELDLVDILRICEGSTFTGITCPDDSSSDQTRYVQQKYLHAAFLYVALDTSTDNIASQSLPPSISFWQQIGELPKSFILVRVNVPFANAFTCDRKCLFQRETVNPIQGGYRKGLMNLLLQSASANILFRQIQISSSRLALAGSLVAEVSHLWSDTTSCMELHLLSLAIDKLCTTRRLIGCLTSYPTQAIPSSKRYFHLIQEKEPSIVLPTQHNQPQLSFALRESLSTLFHGESTMGMPRTETCSSHNDASSTCLFCIASMPPPQQLKACLYHPPLALRSATFTPQPALVATVYTQN